ncbi:hypothetical protein NCCP1664_04760 [Zafaria cholistanensis]|uniref:Uncharacterized protein n=1 Tax=Zafaria cholistanensis TaxID=1682741 RepID=A0A5A7NN24_9MICC|nr:accessory Sec system protein Asp2 [Zafaria cholistanensis]GER21979.1 hypothetical protein NCCP1664_04760 [Zafaria cholistanensis]
MPGQDLEYVRDGVRVEYKRRAGKLDRRHLIVMFTGLKPIDSYDFDGRSSADSQAHWLWMKDKFGGHYAYYVRRGMDPSIEHAVIGLIDAELERLGLTRDQCTLAGISKGGFAALYFGIKYNFRNIVASAPQIYLGTHTRTIRPKIFGRLSGNGGDREQRALDALIPDAVAADTGTDKNIYLFSSPQDQFHEVQVAPALEMFGKYPNFNYVETDSDLVRDHASTIRYNLPLVLSVLYAVADNIAPRFGRVRNGNPQDPRLREEILHRQRSSREAVAALSSARLAGPLFFPAGTGFLRGHEVDRPADLDARLVLAGSGGRREFALETAGDTAITFRHYRDAACNYRKGGFTSPRKAGLDLSGLPGGTYEVLLRLALPGHGEPAAGPGSPGEPVEVPLRSDLALHSESQHGGRLIRFRADGGRATLDIRSVAGPAPKEAIFRLRKSWARGPLVHMDGDFAVRGVQMPERNTGTYYLVLRGNGELHARPLVCSGTNGPADSFGDGLGNYACARFGTWKRQGVDVSGLPPGRYEVAVTLSCAGGIFTLPAGKVLVVGVDGRGGTTTALGASGGPLDPSFLGRLRRVPLRRLRPGLARRVRRRLGRLYRR